MVVVVVKGSRVAAHIQIRGVGSHRAAAAATLVVRCCQSSF